MEATDKNNDQDWLTDVGSQLRGARLDLGLSISAVARELRLAPEYIKAIENGDWDGLPTRVYALGYIRSYAGLVELDYNELYAKFKETDTPAKATRKTKKNDTERWLPLGYESESKGGKGRFALFATVAVVMLYGGWYGFNNFESAQELGQNLTGTSQNLAANSSNDNATAADSQTLDLYASAPESTQEENTQEESTQEENTQELGAPKITQEITQENTPEDAPRVATDAVAASGVANAITIMATANSWVEVTYADGQVALARLMNIGDTYVVTGDDDLYLTTGNAGGLDVVFGDGDAITLGDWGDIVRELPLNATIIKERY